MGKTLFISDLDGTLLNKDAKITPFTAKTINKLIDDGLIFTYATARSFYKAEQVADGINFKYPAVYHNGAFIQHSQNGEYIERCFFDKNIISQIIRKFQENELLPLIFSLIDGRERVSWIQDKKSDGIQFYLRTRSGDKRLRPVKNYGEFLDGDIHEISFVSKSANELQSIMNSINLNEYFSYSIQEDNYKDIDGNIMFWLWITRFDAGKDSGVRKVKELVGADKIVCFGDNINDIPMFNVSDEKYAVENAVDELKNIATAVIGSNEDDGVAKWLGKNAGNYL